MTLIKYNKPNDHNENIDLQIQKMQIEHHYDFIKTEILNHTLFCSFEFKDDTWAEKYTVCISYKSGFKPTVFIKSPQIVPSVKIHMFDNGSLCLYDPNDYPIRKRFCLATEIIPWVIKWIFSYEVFKINGNVWISKEAYHSDKIFLSLRRKLLV
jgi:hypothetical protein